MNVILNYEKIDNIVFGDINHSDYPDYCDAYIVSADYDGIEMTDEQLTILNEDKHFMYEQLWKYLH